MLIAIQRESHPRRPTVSHSPQHFQADQIVEPITGINEHCAARLCFLSEELKGFQCLLSTSTPFLALASLILHTLHPQRLCYPLRRFLLGARRLYVKIIHEPGHLSTPLSFIFGLIGCLILRFLSPFPYYRQSPLPHGMGCPFYAGLEACTQLKVAARRLCLVLGYPHDDFS